MKSKVNVGSKRWNIVLSLLSGDVVALTVCVAIVFVLPIGVFAQIKDNSLNDILKKMEEAEKKINTLKADYTRSIFFESTKERQEFAGTLFLKKPDSIYIKQKTPQEQRIYIDGKNITVYVPENEQAVIDDWKNVADGDFAPAAIISFGSNWRKIKKTNVISFGGENEKYVVIKVNPMRNKDWNVKIYVSKTTMYPGKAVIESDGVKAEIIFKSYTLNPALDKNIFKFNASVGVEIIKLN
ncbi:MAG: outer-membrane lipoprotein carrier protein LolA [Endomicrobium sp.]|nr:outer-membrane lipoprotein carrier protein LolA [Endomicrobium sp.]